MTIVGATYQTILNRLMLQGCQLCDVAHDFRYDPRTNDNLQTYCCYKDIVSFGCFYIHSEHYMLQASDCDSTAYLHTHHNATAYFSLAGCPEASICNIYRAVQAITEQGSLGVIVAHWSGSYHLTPHPFSWPGFVVGSGLSWNPATHWVSATV